MKTVVVLGLALSAELAWARLSARADVLVPPAPAVRSFTDIMSYTTYFWEWMTPETRGLTRVEPGLQVFRSIESKTVPVSDFASVSNVDDPENWFSLWF